VPKRFASFAEFYPVYLAMHSNRANRRLHLLGNGLGLGALAFAVATQRWWALAAAPALANACAWIGHLVFQKNRPGVFGYPLYGMLGSWVMTWEALTSSRRRRPS
jgi:hypothetical protein